MPFLNSLLPQHIQDVFCGAYVALPRFTFALREKSGSATVLARESWDVWQCHMFHAFRGERVAVPTFPCARGPSCGKCVAVPQLSRTLCPFCVSATVPVHGRGDTRAKVLASKQEWGGRSFACVVGKSSVAGGRWRQTARMMQAASALAPASTPWYAIIPSTSA